MKKIRKPVNNFYLNADNQKYMISQSISLRSAAVFSLIFPDYKCSRMLLLDLWIK